MLRFLSGLAFALVALAVPLGVLAADASGNPSCRPEFIVPYSDQCTFAYRAIGGDRSPASLQNAFTTCDRAQNASVPCMKSPTKQIHLVAINATYTDVSAQAEVAMYAGQYAVAETLLREKLSILDAIGQEAKPGDKGLVAARTETEQDIADTLAGQCTWKALAAAGQQQVLVKTHRFGDLSTLLARKATDYAVCARLAATPQHRAYVEYMGYVALEEGGRAAQAAGQRDNANHLYRTCIDGTARAATYAAHAVKGYLGTVNALCRGRLDGRYRVDQPEPIDADDGKHFRPLTLPKA